MKKSKRKTKKRIFFLLFLCLMLIIIFLVLDYKEIMLSNIKLLDYNFETKDIKLEIDKANTLFHKEYDCIIYKDSKEIKKEKCKDNCIISLNDPNNVEIRLKDKKVETKKHKLKDYIKNKFKVTLEDKELYLAKGESMPLKYKVDSIFDEEYNIKHTISNNKVIKVEDNKITALDKGTSNITIEDCDEVLKINVTDLITKATLPEKLKSVIPCNHYSKEDSDLLDLYLEKKIEQVGKGTRAGVVEAARFLTLEFPYRIPYFFENGRMYYTGVRYIDGEGRYYHKGLYLHKDKMKDVKNNMFGPAIWGCPLKNQWDEVNYGFRKGQKVPNGLDCSGFVSWCILNGGFDPGDMGAGASPRAKDLTDLGERLRLTSSLYNSNKIKAGDLASDDGHIGIIVGIKDGNIYVAETLPEYYGVVVRKYNEKNITKYFTHVVLMDKYYKNDGDYTSYWE